MLYYEQKEKEILTALKEYQKGEMSLSKLTDFCNITREENIKYGLTVQPEDNYNFFRYEKYWNLLLDILQNNVDKDSINEKIYTIKAEEFIERVKSETKKISGNTRKINKPVLYFDNNIFINMKRDIPIERIKNEIQFVYSPAHLEELANSIREKNFEYNDYIKKDLEYLSNLTNNLEFLPDLNKGIIICEESPEYPLERVIKNYDGTILSEKLEKDFLEKREKIRKKLSLKTTASSIKGVLKSKNGEKLLNEKIWYKEYKNLHDKTLFWNKYKNNNDFLFSSLPGIVEIIELLDNNPEPSRKYRSHLHDTTHIIYATQSDIFVTNDRRLSNKATEIFDFLGIQTKILNYETFSELYLL